MCTLNLYVLIGWKDRGPTYLVARENLINSGILLTIKDHLSKNSHVLKISENYKSCPPLFAHHKRKPNLNVFISSLIPPKRCAATLIVQAFQTIGALLNNYKLRVSSVLDENVSLFCT